MRVLKLSGLEPADGTTDRPKDDSDGATAQVHKRKPRSATRKPGAAQNYPSEKTPSELI